jgi:hypothetical protein
MIKKVMVRASMLCIRVYYLERYVYVYTRVIIMYSFFQDCELIIMIKKVMVRASTRLAGLRMKIAAVHTSTNL